MPPVVVHAREAARQAGQCRSGLVGHTRVLVWPVGKAILAWPEHWFQPAPGVEVVRQRRPDVGLFPVKTFYA